MTKCVFSCKQRSTTVPLALMSHHHRFHEFLLTQSVSNIMYLWIYFDFFRFVYSVPITPAKRNMSPTKRTISKGNVHLPTIEFQQIFFQFSRGQQPTLSFFDINIWIPFLNPWLISIAGQEPMEEDDDNATLQLGVVQGFEGNPDSLKTANGIERILYVYFLLPTFVDIQDCLKQQVLNPLWTVYIYIYK